jgi:hypothetical protein
MNCIVFPTLCLVRSRQGGAHQHDSLAAYCDVAESGRQALFLNQLLGEGDNPEAAR